MPLPQLASFAGNFCTRRKATSDAHERVILRSLAHGRRNPARSALPARNASNSFAGNIAGRRLPLTAKSAAATLAGNFCHSPEGDLRRSRASHLALARARSPESGSFGAPGETKEMPLPQLASFAGNFCTRRKATSDARAASCRCDLYLPANGSGVKVYFVDRYS